ncbi:hypothetical protein B7463_g7114, partial [Scytalidium lignicola]
MVRLASSFSLLALASSAVAAPPWTAPHPGSPQSIKNLKDKIKNVVLITMENRSLDNLLGGQRLRGLENPINNGPFCNPLNVTSLGAGKVCSKPNDFDSILNDPDHSIHGNNLEFYGTFEPSDEDIQSSKLKPNMQGFVHEQIRIYTGKADTTTLSEQVMNYYTEDQVPVITSLSHNFVVFNHWHSGIPGPTDPNRAVITSGTSAGHGTNDAGFGQHVLPQRSIFQQLSETNHTWANYYSTTNGADALYYNWTVSTGHNSATYIKPLENFFQDAYLGRLPEFTYINPSCCGVGTTSMHPSGLISDGEVLLKQLYDAVRTGPQWKETLFIITFDETGGFHDHVPPPLAPRPDNITYSETTPDGSTYTYNFDRLGGRLPTWLISPWVQQGFVEQQGKNSAGQTISYSAESTLRTLGYLWDFEPFNPRVEHAPSFDHLIGTRTNKAPAVMPAPHTF